MKILQINAVSSIRSTGRTCSEMMDYMDKHGDDMYIAYSVGPRCEKGYKIGSSMEVKLHSLLSRVLGLQSYFSRRGTRKLLDYMEELKPDVVHLRNLHGNFIHLKLLLQYLAEHDIPTVLTLHDCWFFTGKCCHYTVQGCYKWQSGCSGCPLIRKENPSWFFDRTKKMYRDKKEWLGKIPRLAVVGVSDWITREAGKSFLRSAKIVTRIYNWIDTKTFKPVDASGLCSELGLSGKFVILGVASGWNDKRGLNRFIELAKRLDDGMRIVLVGRLCNKLQLPESILNIPETHDVKELARYYSMADVYINMAYEETFGKTTAEAMACGTPVIVFNSTANPELVGEGCGFVLNGFSPDVMMEHIREVKGKGKAFYMKNCMDYVKDRFDMEKRIKDYIEVYKGIQNI